MYNLKSQSKNILIFLAVFLYFINTACFAYTEHDRFLIEKAKKETRAKIQELRRKERVEVHNLTKIQEKLEKTSNEIQTGRTQLDTAKSKLETLKESEYSISAEQAKVEALAAKRIREIYKGERTGLLCLLLESKDINSFIDRMYFQRRLASKDKSLLSDLRAQTERLYLAKQNINSQKEQISLSLNLMELRKRQINSDISSQRSIINKLRTDRRSYEAAERALAQDSERIARALRGIRYSGTTKTGFRAPVMARITSPFGWRRHPIFGTRSFHSGVDLAAPNRTPIRAANGGKVVQCGWYGGYGKVVIIDHGLYKGRRTSSLYAHLSSTAVGMGQTVSKGSVVGYEGTTGYSTGPHLHFEIRINGTPTNPLNYIR